MYDSEPSDLRLVGVDDATLEALVHVATTDALANEVTPPLTEGGEWSPTRVAWLRDYHVGCRAGLAGPRREATWAVVSHDEVQGAVRLARTSEANTLETGIWLAGSARGKGLGKEATRLVLQEARFLGYARVIADTAATNTAATRLLKAGGFTLEEADTSHRVGASIVL